MIQRCENTSHASYPRYGGRGITVCDKWRKDYLVFLAHVGRRPSPSHSLDRIDSDKGYEPGNVQWADAVQQANNTRANRRFEFHGERKTVPELARMFKVPSSTIWRRLRLGWTIDAAVMTPVRVQANNAVGVERSTKTSGNRWYEHEGRMLTLKELATELGVTYLRLYNALVTRGEPLAKALERVRT